MTPNNIIINLKRDLIRAFAVLDAWFDKDEELFYYGRAGQQTRAFDIIQRIVITNGHLLSLINNGCKEALAHAKQSGHNLTVDDYDLKRVAIEDPLVDRLFKDLQHEFQHQKNEMSLALLREELRDQLYRSLCQLELLKNGEGALHAVSLSESATEKIDVYQLMHLLSVNIWKHLGTLRKIEEEYVQKHAFGCKK
jgi:hypothetical protein